MGYKKEKNAGVNPLGHSPFGREKLEGPKVHHDFHGSDASRPEGGNNPPVPRDHWEMHYSLCDPNHHMIVSEGDAFDPQRPGARKTTHLKVNEEDH